MVPVRNKTPGNCHESLSTPLRRPQSTRAGLRHWNYTWETLCWTPKGHHKTWGPLHRPAGPAGKVSNGKEFTMSAAYGHAHKRQLPDDSDAAAWGGAAVKAASCQDPPHCGPSPAVPWLVPGAREVDKGPVGIGIFHRRIPVYHVIPRWSKLGVEARRRTLHGRHQRGAGWLWRRVRHSLGRHQPTDENPPAQYGRQPKRCRLQKSRSWANCSTWAQCSWPRSDLPAQERSCSPSSCRHWLARAAGSCNDGRAGFLVRPKPNWTLVGRVREAQSGTSPSPSHPWHNLSIPSRRVGSSSAGHSPDKAPLRILDCGKRRPQSLLTKQWLVKFHCIQ